MVTGGSAAEPAEQLEVQDEEDVTPAEKEALMAAMEPPVWDDAAGADELSDAEVARKLPVLLLALVTEEMDRWGDARRLGRPCPVLSASEGRSAPSKTELGIARLAYKAPSRTARRAQPFIARALGGCGAATHDAAARSLAAIIAGADAREGGGLRNAAVLRLANEMMRVAIHNVEAAQYGGTSPPSLGLGAAARTDCTARLVPFPLHLITSVSPQRALVAMPAITRDGAAVLRTPPEALTLLRRIYFEALEAAVAAGTPLPTDPTSVQRRESDKSPIYNGLDSDNLSNLHVPGQGRNTVAQVPPERRAT